MRSHDEVRALLRRVLEDAGADEAEARYTAERTLSTRFGDNAITQNSVADDETLTVELVFGRRHGSASTNRIDDPSGLAAVVARAREIAQSAPEDPEWVELPGPQHYGERPQRWFPDTAHLGPDGVADDVAQVVDAARAARFHASGLFQVRQATVGIANTRGLWGWDAETGVDYSTTVHGPAGSGKAAQAHSAHERLDVGELARAAVHDARLAQEPQPIEPGVHTVVFEPLAVRSLLGILPWALDAREADEGTSVFAGQLGQRLLGSATLGLDTDDPELPAPTMGERGRAIRPTRWVEDGVVRRLAHDPFWAAHKGEQPDPARAPLFMAGGAGTVDDLVAGCERGLLVKNLWYVRNVDWRTHTLTGMTRDGVYLIERGRIVRPVRNLRWNESPVTFLRNVVALSRPVRCAGWLPSKMPGARSEGFTFTSVTDAV